MKTCACGKCNLDKTELKTLKDIKKHWIDLNPNNRDREIINRIFDRDIREQAIKWIKEDIEYIGKVDNPCKLARIMDLYKWMERFNITEEDLK